MRREDLLVRASVLAATVVLSWALPTSAAVPGVSTWDDGTMGGWTARNGNVGRWETVSSGGNPSGYVRFYDLDDFYVADELHAPAWLQGNYGSLTNPRFEFDMKAENPATGWVWISFQGPGCYYWHVTPVPSTSWAHYVLPLQEASWNRSSGSWSELLANVTNLSFMGEVVAGCDQAELALDNFALVDDNQSPMIDAGLDQTITLPTNSVSLVGTASDDGLPSVPGTLTKTWSMVSGPVGGTVIFADASQLSTTATFDVGGIYVFQLLVSDGQASSTDTVTITVNQSPVVDAGPDQIVTLPANVVTLAGTASDDELPGVLATTWSLVSGPEGGTVTLADAAALSTTATFDVAGVYVLQLLASDGTASATDTLSITVNQAAVVDAGADQTITLPTNSVSLIGTASDDGLPGTLGITWSLVSGPEGGTVTFADASVLSTAATFNIAGVYVLQLLAFDGAANSVDTVPITVNQVPVVDAGPDQVVTLPTNVAILAGTVSDDQLPGMLSSTWSLVSGPEGATVSFADASALSTTATFSTTGIYVLELSVSDGTVSAADTITITVHQAPVVDAGPDQIITLPTNSVNLTGTASDDGLPSVPGMLSNTWSKVSGPGTVTFANLSALSTSATFSIGGVYVLRLSVFDGAATITDDVTVTVNQSPVVNAGTNRTITLPTNLVNLTGTASDDGLPGTPGALTYTWSKVSGPGTVTFTNAHALSTAATFSAGGVYILRLLASDGAVSPTDTVTVTVNQAPVVNAGTDRTITLPTNAVSLAGTATDDGLPGTLSVTWSKVSGPSGGTVTFANPNALSTTATFNSIAGIYVLRLRGFDGIATVDDTVSITINRPPTVNAGADTWSFESVQVYLVSTASDPDGDSLSYRWTQTAGKAIVNPSRDYKADYLFTCPVVATWAESGITLRITVNDPRGGTASDYVNVRVRMVGDADGSGLVGTLDLVTVTTAWGTHLGDPNYDLRADFNGDDWVDQADLNLVVANWGRSLQ